MLKITLLGLWLFVGSLFAQDNLNKISSTTMGGYSASISLVNKIESIGKNPVSISVYNKGKILSGIDVNLILFMPDDKTVEYKHIKSIDNHYLADVNFSAKGKYTYSLKFSTKVGYVSHYLRGDFEI